MSFINRKSQESEIRAEGAVQTGEVDVEEVDLAGLGRDTKKECTR